MTTYTTIGKPALRVDGEAKVTGKAVYAADVSLPGLLWGKVLRSPHPHARILRVDASRAQALPGVHAVVTGADLQGKLIGRRMRDWPLLAYEKVRYVGDRVAAVAATDPDLAEEALSLIEVEYEELPPVFDPLEAMQQGAPLVHDNPAAYEGAPQPRPPIPNLQSYVQWYKGDVERGLEEADRVFEHTFRTPLLHQGYIEPHACVVWVEPSGRAQVWASNKTPYLLRRQLSLALGVPEEGIKVHMLAIGGDFGGKGSPMDIPLCYVLSQRTGRPVKMVMSSGEELMAGNPRHPSIITLRTGVKGDGTLWALDVRAVFNGGAYAAFKPNPVVNLHGAHQAGSCYRIPHARVESYCIYTNTVPCGHMRAPGAPQVTFAVECQLDIIAQALGLDPAEFRRRNLLEEGDVSPLGERWHGIRAKDTLDRALQASGWGQPKPGPYYGRGLAMYNRPVISGQSSARLSIEASGQVTLVTPIPDTGTGAHTILQQMVAEELRLPLQQVRVLMRDTDTLPYDSGVGGSRVTSSAGRAAWQAAVELRQKLLALAAESLGWPEEQISLEDGHFRLGEGEEKVPLNQLLPRLVSGRGEPITVEVVYNPTEQPEVTSFCAQVAEVEVDPETGQVRVHRIVSAHDVGTVLNPVTHRGQIEGGIIQGLGFALMEEMALEEGRVTTLHWGDYKIPNIKDIPNLVTVLLEEAHGPAPYQSKAIGEISNVPVAAAVANAVYDAVKVRLFDLPISGEKVYRALKGQG